ncbi:MAG: DUF1761 domain-containing protein [Pseudomonadota bacterium]|nr:DUF1761 domain-containing protein [Pseudomonadota bacterium]
MTFAGINYLAVVLAAVAGFFVGWPWYMAFGKYWAAALGKDPNKPPKPTPAPFIILIAAELVLAFVLAGLIGHMGEVTLKTGLISAAFAWAGFVLTTMVANHAFQGFGRNLTLVDGGHWLAVMLVMGAVIGTMGV